MLQERIEGKWIEAFAKVFGQCDVKAGDPVAIFSETQSRPVNVHLAELALLRLGARPFHVVVPSPAQTVSVPIRSTGGAGLRCGVSFSIAATLRRPSRSRTGASGRATSPATTARRKRAGSVSTRASNARNPRSIKGRL